MCHHLDSPHNPVHAHECVCYASLVHMSLPTVFHQEKWLPFDLWDYERTCCWLVIFLWERWVLVKSLLGKLTGRLTKYCNGFFFLNTKTVSGQKSEDEANTHTHCLFSPLPYENIFIYHQMSFISICPYKMLPHINWKLYRGWLSNVWLFYSYKVMFHWNMSVSI